MKVCYPSRVDECPQQGDRRDLNPQPSDPQSDVPPLNYDHHERRVRESNSRRVEPNAFSKRVRQANIRLFSTSDPGETRTRNLSLRRAARYPIAPRGRRYPQRDSNPQLFCLEGRCLILFGYGGKWAGGIPHPAPVPLWDMTPTHPGYFGDKRSVFYPSVRRFQTALGLTSV